MSYALYPFGGLAPASLSDSAAQPTNRGFIMLKAGDAKVTPVNGAATVFTALPVGTIVPVPISLAWSTGTTAGAIGLLS